MVKTLEKYGHELNRDYRLGERWCYGFLIEVVDHQAVAIAQRDKLGIQPTGYCARFRKTFNDTVTEFQMIAIAIGFDYNGGFQTYYLKPMPQEPSTEQIQLETLEFETATLGLCSDEVEPLPEIDLGLSQDEVSAND